jgi:hypothetical protein
MHGRLALLACIVIGATQFACDSKSNKAPKTPTSQAAAQKPAAGSAIGGPRWVCAQAVIDFGEVWAGATVERQFEFRNAGTEVLKILKIKPRCSCSAAPNYSKEVPPGGTGSIPFILRTDNKHNGPLDEYLTIDTNDPANSSTKISLKGVIRTVVEAKVTYDAVYERDKAAGKTVEPPTEQKASFGRISSTDKLLRVIRLHNTSGQPLSLTLLPLPADARFKAELKEVVPNEEFDLTVWAEPPIPVGRWSTPIRFQTNIPTQPFYQVYAAAYVPPRIEVMPPELMVIDQDIYPQKERQITITNNGTTAVEIMAISTSEPRFGIGLLPPDPAKPQNQVINITLPGGESYRPPRYGELIEIKTNDGEVPLIRVSILPSLNAPPVPRPADQPLVMHPVTLPRRK